MVIIQELTAVSCNYKCYKLDEEREGPTSDVSPLLSEFAKIFHDYAVLLFYYFYLSFTCSYSLYAVIPSLFFLELVSVFPMLALVFYTFSLSFACILIFPLIVPVLCTPGHYLFSPCATCTLIYPLLALVLCTLGHSSFFLCAICDI